jgi:hypothetical protein
VHQQGSKIWHAFNLIQIIFDHMMYDSCNKNKKGGKNKPGEKIKKEKENINLVLSHVNCAFFILESKPLDNLIVA